MNVRLMLASLILACGHVGHSEAQRVFVASGGNDANAASGCTLAAPCRSFATAIAQVTTGGEVIALDAAGYGPMTIDKSITVTANAGYFAGIAASSGSAITVTGSSIHVVLRGLHVQGAGAATGIQMSAPFSLLTLENCVVANFAQHGIEVTTPDARLRVLDTIVRGNGSDGEYDGIRVRGKVSLNNVKMSHNGRAGLGVGDSYSTVHVTNSDASFNKYGFLVTGQGGWNTLSIIRSSASKNTVAGVGVIGPAAAASVAFSHISGNAVAFHNAGSVGNFQTLGNNVLRHNGTATSGTITTVMGQ